MPSGIILSCDADPRSDLTPTNIGENAMNELHPFVSAPPPTVPRSQKPWRRSKIILGALLGLLLIVKIITSYDPVTLDVSVRYNRLKLGNVGSKPIKITGIEINQRTDCTVALPLGMFTDPNKLEFSSRELKVGDEIELVSACKIVRAHVETDQGSETYSLIEPRVA
jgi:hypothetical protein